MEDAASPAQHRTADVRSHLGNRRKIMEKPRIQQDVRQSTLAPDPLFTPAAPLPRSFLKQIKTGGPASSIHEAV
jgi:hypothetical protein